MTCAAQRWLTVPFILLAAMALGCVAAADVSPAKNPAAADTPQTISPETPASETPASEDPATPWSPAPASPLTQEEFPLPRHDPRPLMQKLIERKEPTASTPFTFVVLADWHARADAPGIFNLTDKLQPDFILTLGDMVNTAGPGLDDWRTLERVAGDLFRKYPTWSVMGNHDGGSHRQQRGRQYHSAYWAQPHNDIFHFTYANATFIGLPWYWSPEFENVPKKLEQALAAAQGTHIFVFSHYVPWAMGLHPREQHIHLLAKYNVLAVLDAHIHTYRRGQRYGVQHISAGINGPRRPPDEGNKQFLIQFTVDGERVTLRLLDAEGKEWDRATLAGPQAPAAAEADRQSADPPLAPAPAAEETPTPTSN